MTIYRSQINQLLPARRRQDRIVFAVKFATIAAALIFIPIVLDSRYLFGLRLSYQQTFGISLVEINFALIAVIGAVSLNVLTGWTGLISLGHAGFFALGGIAGAFFGLQLSLPFPLVLLLSGVVGALGGAIVGLPSLRVSGLYLMLATLALHFIVIFAFLWYQIANFGLIGIPYTTPDMLGFKLDTTLNWYWVLLVLVIITIVVHSRVRKSHEGRALMAVRDNEIAAAASGINVGKQKLKAFALSSFFATIAGTLFVWNLGTVTNEVFTVELAIGFITMLIIGGLGSITGAVIGAFAWQLLPAIISAGASSVDRSAPLVGEFFLKYEAQVEQLILGLVAVLILLFRPDGIHGAVKSLVSAVRRWPSGQ